MAIDPASEATASDDFNAHMSDYSDFIRMFKYGAIAAFAVGLLVLFIL
ncbi:MAG: aa3-type cytochrome c oxidase subunit IV [Sphingomicrobium sp.]